MLKNNIETNASHKNTIIRFT